MWMGYHTHFPFEYICIYMYWIMHKLIFSSTPSQWGVQMLPSLDLIPVLNMSLLIQWFSKVIYWLVFSPDIVDSDFPSIHVIPEVM